MWKVLGVVILVMGLVLSISCASASPGQEDAAAPEPAPAPTSTSGYQRDYETSEAAKGSTASFEGSGYEEADEMELTGEEWATERMIVRTGNLELTVKDVSDAVGEVKRIADRLGGYVVSSRVHGGEEHNTADVSIRVPAQKYDEAMESVRNIAIEVTLETNQAKDVTEEYTDLESKLRNLEATEQRYLEILEKAETVEDILEVERALSETRGKIEQTKGRMQYLERTSSTSLIEVHLEEERALEVDFEASKIEIEEGEEVYIQDKTIGGSGPYGYSWDFGNGESSTDVSPTVVYEDAGKYTVSLTVTDGEGNSDTETKEEYIKVVPKPGWSPGNVARSAWHGLVATGHVLGNIVIWLGILAVIWVPVLVIALLVRRHRRKA
ncbi:MAG: DUF4349 domain-containing protein [Dehalococcoidia bacterium]